MKIYSYFNCKPCFVYFMTFIMYSCSWSTCSPAPWSGLSRLRFTLAQTSKNGFSMPFSKLAKSFNLRNNSNIYMKYPSLSLVNQSTCVLGLTLWFYWKYLLKNKHNHILSVTIPPWITILFKNTASFYVYLLPALPLFQPEYEQLCD